MPMTSVNYTCVMCRLDQPIRYAATKNSFSGLIDRYYVFMTVRVDVYLCYSNRTIMQGH